MRAAEVTGASVGSPLVALQAHAARGAWSEALDQGRALMRDGLAAVDVLHALARGALQSGRPDRAKKALDQLKRDDDLRIAALRFEVILGLNGREAALAWADNTAAAQAHQPEWVAWGAQLREGLAERKGTLPLETLSRVRALAAGGHPGRGLRLARRLRLTHPNDAQVIDAMLHCAEQVAGLELSSTDVLRGAPLPELDQSLGLAEVDFVDLGPEL